MIKGAGNDLSRFLITVPSRIRTIWMALHANQKLYLSACTCFALYWLIPANFELEKGAKAWAAILWISAMALDSADIYKKIYSSLIGKLFLFTLITLGSNFVIALSGQAVNELVQTEPSKFIHTITYVSILIIPSLMGLVGYVLMIVLLISFPLYLGYHLLSDDTKRLLLPGLVQGIPYPKVTAAARFLSFFVLCLIVFNWSQDKEAGKTYGKFVSDQASSFIYNFEMYSKLQCNLYASEKGTMLEGGLVLVGNKDHQGIHFKIRECKE